MKENPKFSIVVPSYNRAYILGRLFESLVEQTYRDFEVLLIDDGSTDNTEEVCCSYQEKLNIRYFKKENGGKHTALNVGIEKAEGEYFIILDSKSRLLPNALERLERLWRQIPDKEKFATVSARRGVDGILVGTPFPQQEYVSSMTDFHFLTGYKEGGGLRGFGDCLMCDRTEVMKKYRFPESEFTKFVPEYYIYDQIGEAYKMYCVNEMLEETEYLEDGITKNAEAYYKKNFVGILYGVANRLDAVLYKNKKIPLKPRIEVWLTYWTYVEYDKQHIAPRVQHMTALGVITKIYYMLRRRTK